MFASILTLLSVTGIVAIQVIYIIEAAKRGRGEGLIALLVPPYVWYFAFVKSRQSPYLIFGQALLTALFFAAGILRFQAV
ncbi:MAG: hypothetical protein ACI8W8_002676 [Rhodothermales bacterium]|jgi:hypothetical protein